MAKSGFFRNVMDAIVTSRSKHAEREVARFVETHGYRNLLNEERSRNSF
ncbi:hypothetical protein [Maritalea porphyrae]|uniref:Uncharacterized protein n=1 Tax=Maritalea porphyrae TaxID=880732 RepID=A0ABQ5UVN8_9HYPH|nr:hypothetical protein [Maritalea porphyrae]GLQ18954.1 hypothetical protein GCM10007879_32030 [Maritalea porphyrae]